MANFFSLPTKIVRCFSRREEKVNIFFGLLCFITLSPSGNKNLNGEQEKYLSCRYVKVFGTKISQAK
jgi:hypothetical protein